MRVRFALALVMLLTLAGAGASAQAPIPQELERPVQNPSGSPELLKQIGIDQKLNGQLPLDALVRDETGVEAPLQSFFRDKPVILAPVYYECPMLCTQILNGLVKGLRDVSYDPGKDFIVLAISIDPRETSELAAAKKKGYLKRYGRPGTEDGWKFLTGSEESVKRIAQALGFRYVWDPVSQQYAHASGIMVATPEGRISHYFYGVEYRPTDMRLALVQASQGKIGSPVDQVLLYCFHYDPVSGKYTSIVLKIVQGGAVLTALALGGLIFYFLRNERKARKEQALAAGFAPSDVERVG
jgi:protein SCO1